MRLDISSTSQSAIWMYLSKASDDHRPNSLMAVFDTFPLNIAVAPPLRRECEPKLRGSLSKAAAAFFTIFVTCDACAGTFFPFSNVVQRGSSGFKPNFAAFDHKIYAASTGHKNVDPERLRVRLTPSPRLSVLELGTRSCTDSMSL